MDGRTDRRTDGPTNTSESWCPEGVLVSQAPPAWPWALENILCSEKNCPPGCVEASQTEPPLSFMISSLRNGRHCRDIPVLQSQNGWSTQSAPPELT